MSVRDTSFFSQIEDRIRTILPAYVAVPSYTSSVHEKEAERFLLEHLGSIPYFREHPEYFGAYALPNDPFDRAAVWALLKGSGDDTVVLMHHYDVVGIEDYKNLGDLAFSAEELTEALKQRIHSLPEEVQQDLTSDEYLFVHGGCDMKAGGSIQLSLLEAYSAMSDWQGNIVLLAVPDEENLSAGMRGGVSLLAELQNKYGLNYKLMINSEPHQRKDPAVGIFDTGSVGKMLPFCYVRGYLSHAGKVFEGLNPSNVLSAVVRRTELNMELSDALYREASPPPTWLYVKEDKTGYDVSMPLNAYGCLSVLTLDQTPDRLMGKLHDICTEAFAEVVTEMNTSYHIFLQRVGRPQKDLPWQVRVMNVSELCAEARANYGATFEAAFCEAQQKVSESILNGKDMLLANKDLIDSIFDYIDDPSPRIVLGLIPPFYPNVCNRLCFSDRPEILSLSDTLTAFTEKEFSQHYVEEHFFTGICDLSYCAAAEDLSPSLQKYMPLFGDCYSIPSADITQISMPGINIGPWGKDFHKMTERVLKEDLYHRTPRIVDYAVRLMLGQETE